MIVPMVIMMWCRETVTLVNDLHQPHSPSWQASSRSDNQDIFRLLGNKDTHYNVRTSPPVFPTLNQCHITALQDYAPVDISTEGLCGSHPHPIRPLSPAHIFLLQFITLMITAGFMKNGLPVVQHHAIQCLRIMLRGIVGFITAYNSAEFLYRQKRK